MLGDYDADFVHARLAVGRAPRVEHVDAIVAAGIRGIVNVASVTRRETIEYVHRLPPTMEWRQLGFWDGSRAGRGKGATAVVGPEYARFIVEEAAQVVREYSPVLIHCAGGRSRSGNLAALLVAAMDGSDPDRALAAMSRHRDRLMPFSHDMFWKGCDVDELIAVARQVILKGLNSDE